MVNLGIDGGAEELGLKCSNTWIHPLNEGNGFDLFRCIRDFEADPHTNDPPMMVTFPSLKDRGWANEHRTTCQLLVLAKSEWFEPSGDVGARTEEYETKKKSFG